jgi:hypothetical protein
MGQTTTQRLYALTEFTSSTPANVNAAIFKQELFDDAGVVEKPLTVARTGSNVLVEWSGVTVAQATLDAVDAAVAAHVGGQFQATPQTAFAEAEDSDDTGDEKTRLTLSTGLLTDGTYEVYWYCEVKVDAEVANSAVEARLFVDKNGGGEVERGSQAWPFPQYGVFSGSFPVVVADGDDYDLRIAYERLGPTSNPAFIRRARLAVTKLNN